MRKNVPVDKVGVSWWCNRHEVIKIDIAVKFFLHDAQCGDQIIFPDIVPMERHVINIDNVFV